MKKLIVSFFLIVATLSASSIEKPTVTNPDSILVQVTLSRLTKATQALVEVKYRRFENSVQDSIIAKKEEAFQKLLKANQLSNERNKEYNEIFKAQQVKIRACDDYKDQLESANKKLMFRQGFMTIGTPIIAIGTSALGFAVGYYVNQLVK